MPDERKFSELTTAATLTNDDILALSQIQSGALTSVKSTLYAIAVHITKLAQYTSDLQTTDKTIIGAINELKRLIALIPQFSIEVVQVLPTEDISDTTIYLVPASDPEAGNYYEEYIHVNNAWELVGSTAVDLSAYYTKLETDALVATKTVTISNTQTAGDTKAKVADITQGGSTFSLYADDAEAVVDDLYTDETTTGNPLTFKSITGGKATACKVTMLPIQDTSQGDPSPTNICPISGRDSATVTRTGVNQWDEEWERGGISASTGENENDNTKIRSKNYCVLFPEFSYYLKSIPSTTIIFFYDENKTFITYRNDYLNTAFTPPQNAKYFKFRIGSGASPITQYGNNVSLNYPSTDTEYHTYQGETHTKEFGQTVYSGWYDFMSGKLIVDIPSTAKVKLSDLNWTYQSAYSRYYTSDLADLIKKPSTSSEILDGMACECYKINALSAYINGQISVATSGNIFAKDENYTDTTTWLNAVGNYYIVFPLATPTQITNDPENVTLLNGQNIISTDADNIELKAAKIQDATGGAGGVDYSTAEQNTGIKWIDGKDVYQKTFVNTDLQHDSNYQGAFLLGQMPSGYDKIIGYEGIAEGTASAVRQFVGFNGINDISGWNCGFHITDGAILIYPAQGTPSQMSSLEGGWAAVTVKYTKA